MKMPGAGDSRPFQELSSVSGLRIIGEVSEETKSRIMVGAEHFHSILKAVWSDL